MFCPICNAKMMPGYGPPRYRVCGACAEAAGFDHALIREAVQFSRQVVAWTDRNPFVVNFTYDTVLKEVVNA